MRDGYIAVGTVDYVGVGPDVYVVRTDNGGGAIWEYTYDIGGFGHGDHGESIVELTDSSGFVIVGYTEDADVDIFLMKIDCDGSVVWTKMYRGPALDEGEHFAHGYDVIEAKTGDGTFGTSPGDLMVCGDVDIDSGTPFGREALLLRTNSSGTLIWNASYGQDTSTVEGFYSLEEASAMGAIGGGITQLCGDVVGVGYIDRPNNFRDGYIVRADGNTGNISGTPFLQGAARYGGGNYDEFFAVTELLNPSETGTGGYQNIVVAGTGFDANANQENYVVKLDDGDPCVSAAQALIGDGGAGQNEPYDVIHDIREIRSGFGGTTVAKWDLVATGETDAGSSALDMFIFGLSPALAPVNGRLFNNADDEEWGWSLDWIDTLDSRSFGFILCGGTTTDWLSVGDPGDVYLVRTDADFSSNTDCEGVYQIQDSNPTGVTCLTPMIDDVLTDSTITTSEVSRDWGDEVCTNGNNSGKAVRWGGSPFSYEASYDVSLAPNTLTGEKVVHVVFAGDELPENVAISIAGADGRIIRSEVSISLAGESSIEVSMPQIPSGHYFLQLDDGRYRRLMRFMVVE